MKKNNSTNLLRVLGFTVEQSDGKIRLSFHHRSPGDLGIADSGHILCLNHLNHLPRDSIIAAIERNKLQMGDGDKA